MHNKCKTYTAHRPSNNMECKRSGQFKGRANVGILCFCTPLIFSIHNLFLLLRKAASSVSCRRMRTQFVRSIVRLQTNAHKNIPFFFSFVFNKKKKHLIIFQLILILHFLFVLFWIPASQYDFMPYKSVRWVLRCLWNVLDEHQHSQLRNTHKWLDALRREKKNTHNID